MARPAPPGPLLGNELAMAIEQLTDKQLRAYQYWRRGHAPEWIASRIGVKRPRVYHLVHAAEKHLGYTPSVAGKQKQPYKSAATKRDQAESAKLRRAAEAWREMTSEQRGRFLRAALPDAPAHIDEREEFRLFVRVLAEALNDDEARERIAKRLKRVERAAERDRQREARAQLNEALHENDGLTGRFWSSDDESTEAAHRGEEPAWIAELGGLRPSELVPDDGRGNDRH